jgi:uncharacterized membrane protein YgcG
MKYVKILLLSFVLFSVNAFALSSPSQIAAMMDSGNLTGAESALIQVLQTKDTAKVHYMLAQVYQKEGRLPDARAELARANEMDPEHSYTDNAHYRPIADAIAGRVVHTNTSLAVGAPVAVMAPLAPAVPIDFSFLKYLLIMAVIALVIWFAARAYLAWQKLYEDAAKFTSSENTLRGNAALLIQDIDSVMLKEKTSTNPDSRKLNALNEVNIKALNVYERSKNLHTNDINEVSLLINEVGSIRSEMYVVVSRNYNAPETSAVKVKKPYQSTVAPVKAAVAPIPTPRHSIPAAQPVITQPQVIRETVVVNNSSAVGDLLVPVWQLESTRRQAELDRERQYREEREAERERQRQAEREEREAEREREAVRERESDSGNNDSWSSSSSDSGNNDSWSSSSSSDSSSSSSSDSGSSDSF